MDIKEAIILGALQGISEWFPISSSGHLVIAKEIAGLKQSLLFDLLLHLGSLLVLLIFFRKDISGLILCFFKWNNPYYIKYRKTALFIIAASVPTALIGFFVNMYVEIFQNLISVGICLLVTGGVLFYSRKIQLRDRGQNLINTVGIGIAQGIAALPGISRSGMTISVARMLGIEREEAARFSFLLFIPAIMGAMVLNLIEIDSFIELKMGLIGMIVSFIIGYLTLWILMKIIKKDWFHCFSYYCFFAGVFCFILYFL